MSSVVYVLYVVFGGRRSLCFAAATVGFLALGGCVVQYEWHDGDAAPDRDGGGIVDGAADAPPGAPDANVDAQVVTIDAAPPLPDAGICPSGCPTGVAFVDPSATLQVGGTGGTGYAEACPVGQVIVGYDGGLYLPDGYIGEIRATCGTVKLVAATLAVTISPGATLTLRGGTADATWSSHCPSNQMVVGFAGRSGLFVDQVALKCAPLIVSGTSGNYSIAIGAVTTLPGVGGNGGTAFDQPCPGGRVATADSGREGVVMDAFGLLCSRAQLTY
jgi:hypothetical protein